MISEKDRKLIHSIRRTTKFFVPALVAFWVLVIVIQVRKINIALAATASYGVETMSDAWEIASTRPLDPSVVGPHAVYLVDTFYSVFFWLVLLSALTLYVYTYVKMARLAERLDSELQQVKQAR